jgi:hypothetical protein
MRTVIELPCLDEFAVTADLIPDKDRLMEDHAVDGHRRASPPGALRRQTAPGEIHLREQPAAKDITVGVRVGGHCNHADERQSLWQLRQRDLRRIARRPRFHDSSSLRCQNLRWRVTSKDVVTGHDDNWNGVSI